jgi:predicted dehydrogenase
MGVYAVTEVTSLLGTARTVRAVAKRFSDNDRAVEDNAALLIEFESGAIGIAETSWAQHPVEHAVAVYGTEGTLRFPHGRRPVAIWRGDGARPEFPRSPYPPVTAHQHFIDCIRRGERALSTPEQGRDVVEIMIAAYRSAETGRAARIRSSYDPRHAWLPAPRAPRARTG